MPYYVSGTGSDGYTPAQAQNIATPWQTIRKALITAPAGATVNVRAGSYARVAAQADVIQKTGGDLTLKPHPGETPTIAGLDLGLASGLIFDGLTFTNQCGFGLFSGGSTSTQYVSNLAVRNCIFDALLQPITMINLVPSSGVVIEDTIFRNADKADLTNQSANGITVRNRVPSGLKIRRCQFRNIAQDGIAFNSSTRGHTDTIIEDNVFDIVGTNKRFADGSYHNDPLVFHGGCTRTVVRRNRIVNGRRGILFDPDDLRHIDCVLENNLIVPETTDYALRAYQCDNMRIVNNTMVGAVTPSTSAGGVNLRDSSRLTVLRNNVIERLNVVAGATFAERGYNLIDTANVALVATEIQSSTPGFVSEAADNYRLLVSSPAKDAGKPSDTNAPVTDLEGLARPVGTRNDIGAYEYGGVPGLSLADSYTLTDAVAQSVSMAFFDTVPWQEQMAMSVSPTVADQLSVADSFVLTDDISTSAGVAFSDSFALTDDVRMAVSMEVED